MNNKKLLLASVALLPNLVWGGGFAIEPQSATGVASGFSGGAAAEDASTLWYNPAGMSSLPKSTFTAVVNAVQTSFVYADSGSTGAFGLAGTGNGGNGGGVTGVPQLYATDRLNDAWSIGIGLNVPFGLKTDYASGWRGQFTALKTEVTALNVNPAVALRLNAMLSLALGIDWQRFSAQLSSFAGPLGIAELKADDTAWGFNTGLMAQLSPGLRIGLAYRSQLSYDLDGHATFSAGNGVYDSGARTRLTVPENVALHLHALLSPSFSMTGSATWTRWSRLDTLRVTRTSASPLGPSGSLVTELPYDWRNTLTVAAGVAYRVDSRFTVRAGIANDPATSNDADRSPRLPDQHRIYLGTGATLRLGDSSTVAVAYAHAFFQDAAIDTGAAGVPGTLRGTFRSSADVLSLQYNLSL